MIGCGWQARDAGRLHPRRRCRRSSASSPTAGPRSGCARSATRSAPSRARATATPAQQDVVVTVTTSRDPVLRGEWLQPGALVCAVGANDRGAARARQRRPRAGRLRLLRLDRADAKLESGDLIEPVERGRPRLARGARAAGGRRRRAARAASRTTTSSSSSRTGSPRGTSRSARSRSSARASAGVGTRASRFEPSRRRRRRRSPSAWITSGPVEQPRDLAAACSGCARTGPRGSRPAARPRSCSRMTYAATRSSWLDERVNRNENGLRRKLASRRHRGDCIRGAMREAVDRRAVRRARACTGSTTRARAERIVIWIERTHRRRCGPSAGRSTRSTGRATSRARDDYVFEGYELDGRARARRTATLEDDARVSEDDGGGATVKPFAREELLEAARALVLRPLSRRPWLASGHSRLASGIGSPCGSCVGKPSALVDPRLELLGDHVLEPVGLVVDGVDVQAERLREVELEQPVVADHLERDPLAGRRSAATPRYGACSTQLERRELLHHLARRGGRDLLLAARAPSPRRGRRRPGACRRSFR